MEVLLAGKWGAIDRFTWQLSDAHVACKQLGFSGAELAVRGATFIFSPKWSASAMNIQWLDNVQCNGNESLLSECPHTVAFSPGLALEAGVVCTSNKSGKVSSTRCVKPRTKECEYHRITEKRGDMQRTIFQELRDVWKS